MINDGDDDKHQVFQSTEDADGSYADVAVGDNGAVVTITVDRVQSFEASITRAEGVALRDALTEWLGDVIRLPLLPRDGVASTKPLVGSSVSVAPVLGRAIMAIGNYEIDVTGCGTPERLAAMVREQTRGAIAAEVRDGCIVLPQPIGFAIEIEALRRVGFFVAATDTARFSREEP